MTRPQNKPQTGLTVPRSASIVRTQKGAALITSMLLLGMLTVLSLTGLRMTGLQEKMTGNLKLLTNAEFAAEQGISEGISKLMNGTINDSIILAAPGLPSSCNPTFTTTLANEGYSFKYGVSHRKLESDPSTCTPLYSGTTAVDADGLPYYQISSTGASGKASLDLEVVINLSYTSSWETGLVGCRGVNFNSSSNTSSYRSSGADAAGDKGDIATTDAGSNITLESNNVILGNVNAVGSLSLRSNSKIERDAYANDSISIESPGSDSYILQDAWSQSSITSGDTLGNDHPEQDAIQVPTQPCDPLDIDAEFTANAVPIKTSNNNGELDLSYYNSSTNNYFISGSDADYIGTSDETKKFYFNNFVMDSDSVVIIYGNVTFYVENYFDLESKAQLVFGLDPDASLTIYVSGMFEMDSDSKGNAQDGGGITNNFQIYSNAETTTYNSGSNDSGASSPATSAMVFLGSNVDFFGTIYAPRSHILNTSNADSKGAMRGRWIEFDSNGTFQYDEDLEDLSSNGAPDEYKLVYWTQQPFTN